MRRDEILSALTALGAELAARGLVADLYVVGGAAITLAYDERRATKDIDAVFIPKNEVYAAAARVAAALDLPDGWLNDAVKGFLLGPDRFPTKTLEMPGLRCEVASAETVLVLKCLRTVSERTTTTLSCSRRSSGWTPLTTCSTSSSRLVTRVCSPHRWNSSSGRSWTSPRRPILDRIHRPLSSALRVTTSKVAAGLVDNGSAGRCCHLRHANLAWRARQPRLHPDEHGTQLLRHFWMLGEEGAESPTPFRHYLASHFLADRLRRRLHSRARIIELVTDYPLPALVTPAEDCGHSPA
jgi:hypothetical protein